MEDVRRLPEIAVPERRALARSDALVGALLLVILLMGGYFRFVGLNWDDFTHLHPDERFLTDVVQGLGNQLNPSGSSDAAAAQVAECMQRYPDTNGKGPYFDTYCSALNPLNANSSTGFYAYGELPLLIVKAAGSLVVQGADVIAHDILANSDPHYATYDGSQWASYDGIQLVWRFLSALAEMGVIFLCFLIGLKLHDRWVGVLAAFLYAATVFSIQMAHFGTVDSMANLFSALAIYFAVLAQRQGKLIHYALFGVVFGCAVASRINMVPLAALIALAGLMQILPAFETRLAPGERTRTLLYHGGGLLLAAFLSLLVFRIFNPYSFTGPGFFGLSLNGRWLDNMNTSLAQNAGLADSPPNYQWAGRTMYLFPWQNMVIWGMGVPLGLVAWIAWAWAGYRMVRSKPGALNNALLFAWVLIYFGWLGHNWVTTMRYFLPAYPVLVVLAAWGLMALIRYARQHVWRRRIALALLCLVGVFSLLWSVMFTNIYRNLLTRVAATYYVWEHVPGDFAMTVESPGQADPVVQVALDSGDSKHTFDSNNRSTSTTFTAPVTGKISAVYANYLDDANIGQDLFYVSITRASDQKLMAEAYFGRDLSHNGDTTVGYAYTVPFTPFTAQQDEQYSLNLMLVDGGPVASGSFSIPVEVDTPTTTPLVNIGLQNNIFGGSQDDLVSRVTRLDQSNSIMSMTFTAPATGTLTSIYAPHLGDPNDDPAPEVLHFAITTPVAGTVLTTATLNTNLGRDAQNILGHSYDIPLDHPLTVQKGSQYDFTVILASGASVISGGSVFTWEGAWDDPVPTTVCALPDGLTLENNPPSGLYADSRDCNRIDAWGGLVNGYEQNIVYEDEPSKRDHLLMTLDNSDYLIITSNRFYDSMARNPMRWPLTNFYYKELFAGDLGYDLEATFQQTFQLGPIKISDQYLPTYTGPQWLNEFESEEAFSVYDHPVVFIFHKRGDYNQQQVHDLLNSVPLTRIDNVSVFNNCPTVFNSPCDPTLYNVATLNSAQAAIAPTNLQLPPDLRATQFDNGTWSQRFDDQSIVNTNQVIGGVVWWATILLFGFAAYPLLFVLLPGLADRGYAFAKFAGMLITGWATWYLASARIRVWSQAGIAGALLILFLIGMALLWRRRDEFVLYLHEHWRLLLGIEMITLIAFLAFVGVRLSNPDLWHPSFGGEKPMDFAFFNGVLRSTVFPPLDPWFSGGFINYYYFGFVIVGTPVLLLKMIPSIAYNLILPTLFALAGVAAFSVAFSLVNAWRERRGSGENGASTLRRLGNPWVAGIAALLLAVVLGNLDTPRVFLTGIAQAGGYVQPQGIQTYLVNQFVQANGMQPTEQDMNQILTEAQDPPLNVRISYEVGNSVALVSSLANGFEKLLTGQNIGIGAERWFWGPTRILAETPGVEGQAITEMPIFTFIYGDMHAHMIAMPMQLAIMGLILNEVLLAGSDRRKRWMVVLATALLGLYVGMIRATNTWDWVTFMLLSVVGLSFAWWVAQPIKSLWGHITRRSLIRYVGYVGGFALFSLLVALPYTTWFVTTYSRVLPWTDGKTPLWAYFDIHGLFLFLVVSLLVWDTARWLRSVYVRSLRGTASLLFGGLMILLAVLLGTLFLALASYQVTLVVLPLLIWIAALFFRSGQSRVMQFVLVLAGLALGLTLGVEYVVLDGDIGRQNTVFKFYIQAWLLFSVVGGVAFSWLINSYRRWKSLLSNVWMFALVLLVGVAALMPIMAAHGKAVFRFDQTQPLTLDGMDYMNYGTQYEGDSNLLAQNPDLAPFPLNEDHAMIRWLQDNVQGTPVIIEGLSEASLYMWNGRIAINTGLPTVIGWNWHEKQQRTVVPLGQLVDARIANVDFFYQTTDIAQAWQILRYYGVSYVIVGRLEQAYYPSEGLAKFSQMAQQGLLDPVFQTGASTIYRVNADAALTVQG